ncbi:hypothetical protein GQ43DRAFT_437677 [Delitschia confertaspora ATCC 74209]|uniref:Uncharacterized protein n=1 Tax=Delitschia confertaspora ATCC 74209 TaxID=1513339 RepID=A0A9P4JWF8_9PLEO|nr:hypothetical protein GQ43DRAFT_437677 [Delitschia confertaspora ATCC 74209]
MATAETATRPHDRHSRKRPFAGWMKRLANLKSSSHESPSKKEKDQGVSPSKKKSALKHNPYPESGFARNNNGNGHHQLSFSAPATPRSNESLTSLEDTELGHRRITARSLKSTAPTVATNPGTLHSETGQSKADTSNTIGAGSTFSSPNHSERSLTTTLTTIQSSAPSNVLGPQAQAAAANAAPVHFSHQFPTSPGPIPSAIPAHLTPQPHPHSYQAATANNILTDNASILTLASSSKRRRRHSLDTNASVRALAPSSVWGGSRESLPLSVLSGNADAIYSPQNRSAIGGLSNTERASVYSSSGVAAPALPSERNSYYANKQNIDGGSVRSGLLGHGRTESITGSIGASPLASPRDPYAPGRMSRRSSDWIDAGEGREVGEEGDPPMTMSTTTEESEGTEKGKVV